ncbi:MAG TPA: BamA/TamA family outer membrane protein, partial [Parachlamydiaceae bacterium]|nr:BamA/TamA family outer membrane protein [Parachlamydiaceae bacterium]
MIFKFNILFVLLFVFANTIVYAETNYAYRVEFIGIDDENTTCLLNDESQLISLADTPPLTAAGLQLRIDNDITILLKVLQSQAYYNASIKAEVDFTASPIPVQLKIDSGPVYTFSAFNIVPEINSEKCSIACSTISLEDIGIEIGMTAYPAAIIEAEEDLLARLAKNGYPLAKLGKREVFADIAAGTIEVNVILDCGPQAFFGETDICGNDTLLPVFFCRKIAWCKGQLYNPALVQRTLNALELSGLFSTINITHDDNADEDGNLTMHITLEEAKKRSIGFGLGYATDLGFGVNADWEHRNISGRGDKISLVGNVWQIKQEGYIRYVLPDFLMPRQDLILVAEAEHEDVKAYREVSMSFSGTIERQMNDRLRVSCGLMFTRLRNTHSNNNRTFSLVKVPMQLFWNGADRVMDPTLGVTMHYKFTPTLQTETPCFSYFTQMLTTTAYLPLDADRKFIIAGRATFGSIWGASKHSIPPSERFYAGSDNILRGYNYLTVCPLNEFNKPIGGRSLMAFSLEARMR